MFRTDADAQIKRALGGLRPTVKIQGDASDVENKIAALAAALKGLGGEANIDIKSAVTDIGTLVAAADALRGRLDNIPVDMNDAKGLSKLYTLIAGADDLQAKLENLDADGDTAKLMAKYYTLEARAQDLETTLSHLDPDGDTSAMVAKLGALKGGADTLRAELSTLRANVSDSAALAKIVTMQGAVLKFAKSLQNIPVTADTLPMEASLYKMTAQVEALKKAMVVPAPAYSALPSGGKKGSNPFEYGTAGSSAIGGPQSQFMDQLAMQTLSAMTSFESLNKAEAANVPVSSLVSAGLAKIAATQGMLIAGNGGGWWGALTTHVRLFGGALDSVLPKFLTSVSAWHIGLDVILEFVAAWAPALIAVGAFAAVAGPVATDIYSQWKNINTVINSVGGKGLPDVGKGFDTLRQAVEPTVITAFGEALKVVGTNSSDLGGALQKVGLVVDGWGASLVNWAGKAEKGFANLVSVGAGDFAALGQGFYQFFRIIAELIKDLPGYVHILLALGDGILMITADVLKALGPLVQFGLAVHGAFLYIGLAVTAVVALGRAMAAAALASFATKTGTALTEAGTAAAASGGKFNQFGTAIGNFGGLLAGTLVNAKNYAGAVIDLGKSEGAGKAAALVLSDAVGAIPFGAAGAAALGLGAIVGVIVYGLLQKGTDASDQFAKSLQTTIAASNTANIQTNLADAVKKTTAAIAAQPAATQQAIKAQQQWNAAVAGAGLHGGGLSDAAVVGAHDLGVYQKAQAASIGDAEKYGQRMSMLASTFGSTASAEAALNVMGISAGAIATENNKTWNQQNTELQALAAGYGYMSQSGNQAANQLNTLNIASGDTTKNLQALTQAESGWITMITGADSSFSGFAQGQQTLATALNSASGTTVTYTDTLGNLQVKGTAAGASMNGLSQASLAARQAFDSQLQSGTTLYGNLQTLTAAAGNTTGGIKNLGDAGKNIVGSLLPMASGSKEATAELLQLADIAGYTGPQNFSSLSHWVGNTSDSLSNLNKEQSQATIDAANLSQAAKNLGNSLQTTITNAQGAAIATQSGLVPATQGLAKAAQNAHGAVTQTATAMSGQYVKALLSAGVSTNDATNYLNAYLKQLGFGPAAIKQIDSAIQGSIQAYQKQSGAQASAATAAQKAKTAFEQFAHDGLGLTATQADKVWSKLSQQDLDVISGKAGNVKKAFVDFANQGLGVSTSKAQELWTKFGQQDMDLTAGKAASAKNNFIQFAMDGLNLTTQQAQALWHMIALQNLDEAANKAGETKGDFEKLATALGDTVTQADNLWNSLHRLPANTPVNIQASLSATGAVKASETIVGGSTNLGELNFASTAGKAAGGHIEGPGTGTSDNIPIMASNGEYMMKAAAVKKYGTGVMDSINNMKFAAGGPVGSFDTGPMSTTIGNIIPFQAQATGSFDQTAVSDFVKALQQQVTSSLQGTGSSAYNPQAARSGSAQVAQSYAMSQLGKYGWGPDQMPALTALWNQESGWSAYALNASSGAAGIAQSLGHGPVVMGDYKGQIDWGLAYIKNRYTSPDVAEAHERSNNWYSKGGPIRPHSAGGTINEPVYGTGAYSGIPYSFAENGPEQIIPAGSSSQATGSVAQPMTTYQGQAVVAALGLMIKLLQGMPYAYAAALSKGAGNGVRKGYYGA